MVHNNVIIEIQRPILTDILKIRATPTPLKMPKPCCSSRSVLEIIVGKCFISVSRMKIPSYI